MIHAHDNPREAAVLLQELAKEHHGATEPEGQPTDLRVEFQRDAAILYRLARQEHWLYRWERYMIEAEMRGWFGGPPFALQPPGNEDMDHDGSV